MELTANQIRYLLTIKKIGDEKHVIRSIDIANEFDYSRASVHKMIKCLVDENLIEKEYYRTIKITPLGAKTARAYLKKYNKVKEALKPVIKLKKDYCLEICSLLEKC